MMPAALRQLVSNWCRSGETRPARVKYVDCKSPRRARPDVKIDLMTASVPAGWYPDPAGAQNSLRWWDGSTWSEHTQPAAPTAQPAYQQRAAQQSYQQPAGQYQQLGSYPPTAAGSPGHTYGDQRFEGHMQVGDPVSGGYRSPMTERNIFVSQKRKLIELTNEYSVFAQDGGQIGTVTEIGQSGARRRSGS